MMIGCIHLYRILFVYDDTPLNLAYSKYVEDVVVYIYDINYITNCFLWSLIILTIHSSVIDSKIIYLILVYYLIIINLKLLN